MTKLTQLTQKLAITLLLALPVIAQANYYCTGNITHLGLSRDRLHINYGFGVHKICLLSEAHCDAWMSTLLAAKMADQTISIYHLHPTVSGNQNSGQCQSIGDWVVPADTVYYIRH